MDSNKNTKKRITLLIINSAEKGISEYTEPLRQIAEEAGSVAEVREYSEVTAADLSLYDGIMVSGSPRGNDIVDHHLPFFQWIKDCRVPILGICAGHHIVGKLYGSGLLRSVEKEVGDNVLFIRRDDPIFKGCPGQFLVRQNHHDSITLPEDFILLANSQGCRVAMMKHPARPIYTMQFHPEFMNKEILLNFIDIVRTHKRSSDE
jgi:GMP synthase (glutamine-hydrolysing)